MKQMEKELKKIQYCGRRLSKKRKYRKEIFEMRVPVGENFWKKKMDIAQNGVLEGLLKKKQIFNAKPIFN